MPQSENRPPLVIRHVDVGALVRAVEQPVPFRRSHGATPPVQLVRDEPEPQDMGDALALDRMDDTLQRAQDDARWGVSFFVHYCGGGDRRGAA